MADREVRIRFTGDSKVLKNSASEVRAVFQKLIEDENDARGAGEKLADAQKTVADKMRAEMKAISETADVLADSLGPEMVAAIEASGRTVEDEVQRFQKLGLTLEDITRDSDLLAAGMKDLDDAARQGSGSIGDGFKKVQADTDKASTAMHNFSGNVVGDLAAAGAGFGPLGEGVGQLIEGALDGEAAFANLAGAAAGMGIIAFAMSRFQQQKERAAKVDAFNKKSIEDYTKALRDGKPIIQAIVDKMEEAGTIEIELGGVLGEMMGGDQLRWFAEAGVTVDQFAAAVAGGKDGVERLRVAMDAAGVSADAQAHILLTANTELEHTEQASKTAAQMSKVFGDTASKSFAEVYGKARSLKDALADVESGWQSLSDAMSDEQTWDDVGRAFDEIKGKLADIDQAERDGTITTEEAARQRREALRELKGSAAEAAQALNVAFPDTVMTNIDLLIDQGSFDEAERRLLRLQAIAAAMKADPTWITAPRVPVVRGTNRAYASGTLGAAPGWALVGEAGGGGELVNFRGGEQVLNARQTGELLTGRPVSARPVVNHNVFHISAQYDFQALVRDLKDHLRRNGGEL